MLSCAIMIDVREIEPFDPARLARGLAATGVRDAALFESSLPGGGERGRGTMRGFAAERRWRFDGGAWTLDGPAPSPLLADVERAFGEADGQPWRHMIDAERRLAAAAPATGGAPPPPADLPPFRGGFAVALSYEAARWNPRFRSLDPAALARDPAAWPLFDLRLYGAVCALDLASGRAWQVTPDHALFARPAAARAEAALAAVRRALAAPGEGASGAPASAEALTSNMTDAQYAAAFERLTEYLRAGDLYQANLTRRFEAPCARNAPALYASLRIAAPAPYACLLDDPAQAIVSASPELFLARRGDRLVTRPIKGTRPRDPDPARDAALVADLLASPKDRAEHVMIVDVHRNDLGMVCRYGSVTVPALAAHEAFPTVHHLTSTIEGRLRPGIASWEAIAHAFPAGSITGAPKRRACEVIEELEPTRREIYCGALGWWDLGGDFALNVAIRTILLSGGVATFQAGGGIVIDSKVDLEAAETWNKARALHTAITGAADAPRAEATR